MKTPKFMKISSFFIVAVILFCFMHEIHAYSDCSVTCPAGCQEQKNCDSVTCVCTCDCSGQNTPPSTTDPTQPPPSTTQPPPMNNPTEPPPSTIQPPPTNNPTQPGQALADQYCSAAGFNSLNCMNVYIPALFSPYLQFGSYCCQNLMDLQTYCVYGYVPPEIAGINFFQYDYNSHCYGN